jgi:hypothetical protein
MGDIASMGEVGIDAAVPSTEELGVDGEARRRLGSTGELGVYGEARRRFATTGSGSSKEGAMLTSV